MKSLVLVTLIRQEFLLRHVMLIQALERRVIRTEAAQYIAVLGPTRKPIVEVTTRVKATTYAIEVNVPLFGRLHLGQLVAVDTKVANLLFDALVRRLLGRHAAVNA
jgi:hypothetical protein